MGFHRPLLGACRVLRTSAPSLPTGESQEQRSNNVLPDHAGYVAIVGKPNSGKSTLLNAILKQKLSIVTSKAQTTRHRIIAVHSEEGFQCIFLDTPGVLRPVNRPVCLKSVPADAPSQSARHVLPRRPPLCLLRPNEALGTSVWLLLFLCRGLVPMTL